MDEEASLKKSELINWYLKEMESEIESESDLIAKKNLIERVLHRLIHNVSSHVVLIVFLLLVFGRELLQL